VPAKPRVISAEYTLLVKLGAPAFALWQGASLVVTWVHQGALSRDWPYLAVMAAVVGLVVWWCAHLKRVSLTDDALLISNFRREIVVPLRDVAHVGQWRIEWSAIVIRLARDTEFGRRIHFIPKRFHFGWRHPMVDRLRYEVAAAKKAEQAGIVA
jgi:hypothetical protein